jgi:hypothetical protein
LVNAPADHADPASIKGPLAFTGLVAVVFVWRTAVTYAGVTYFTLFDDAMISMRYGRNLAGGHGLVWNAGGPRVEGYTNFLWTLWMAVLHLVGASAAVTPLLVVASGLLLLVANLFLVRAVAARLAPDRPTVAVIAGWLTATSYPLIYWSLRGMEVSLIAATTTALTALGVMAVLTRTDAAILAAVAIGFAVAWAPDRHRWRTAVSAGGPVLAATAAHTWFEWAYYGAPLPNTYYLKLAGAPLGARLSRGLASVAVLACASLLPGLVLAGYRLWRARVRPPELLLVALFALPVAYSVYVGGDAWEWMQYPNRYMASGLSLLLLLAALGIDDLTTAAPAERMRVVAGAGALAGAGLLIAVTNAVPTRSLQYDLRETGMIPVRLLVLAAGGLLSALWLARAAERPTPAGPWLVTAAVAVLASGQAFVTWSVNTGLHVEDDNTMAIYGAQLRATTAPTATIAVVWAGAAPYIDDRPAVDLLGKSDAHVARESMRPGLVFYPGHTKWDYAWSIGHLQPDLVAGLVRPTPADLQAIRGWGYDELIPGFAGVWVRQSSTLVDRRRLAGLLESTPRVMHLIDHDL